MMKIILEYGVCLTILIFIHNCSQKTGLYIALVAPLLHHFQMSSTSKAYSH